MAQHSKKLGDNAYFLTTEIIDKISLKVRTFNITFDKIECIKRVAISINFNSELGKNVDNDHMREIYIYSLIMAGVIFSSCGPRREVINTSSEESVNEVTQVQEEVEVQEKCQ